MQSGSIFEVLQVGSKITVHNESANSIRERINSWQTDSGNGFRFEVWTDPSNADPSLPCKAVIVMRCDGMSESDILKAKGPVVFQFQGGDTYMFHPLSWNDTFPPHQRCKVLLNTAARPSRLGWEQMLVGEIKIVRLTNRDLRFLLGRAMVQRNLDWRFEVKRERMMEHGKTPVWSVRRIQ